MAAGIRDIAIHATLRAVLDEAAAVAHPGRIRINLGRPPARESSLEGQMLAGYSDLRTTQRYIEADAEAQRRVVELI
jgi:hypothetical protein